MLKIKVCEIRGKYPVHKVGDKIVIDDAEILLDRTDAFCVHTLSTLLDYVVALDEGADPIKLGLTTSKEKEHIYIFSRWILESPSLRVKPLSSGVK